MNKKNLKELLKKLNYKNQKTFLVFNAPREFLSILWDIGQTIKVLRSLRKNEKISFALTFVRTAAELEKYGSLVINNLEEDAIIWFACPKINSKTYKSEITTRSGWQFLENEGFEAGSMVAIGSDWSALRFKKRH